MSYPPSGDEPDPTTWSPPGEATPPAAGPPPGATPPGYGQQPGYGQPPGYGSAPGYGPPGGGYGYAMGVDHPQGTLILVLGILSLVVCQILGPVAWIMGNTALREIDASPGSYKNRGNVQAGRICGIISTALLALSVVAVIAVIALAAAGSSSSSGY